MKLKLDEVILLIILAVLAIGFLLLIIFSPREALADDFDPSLPWVVTGYDLELPAVYAETELLQSILESIINLHPAITGHSEEVYEILSRLHEVITEHLEFNRLAQMWLIALSSFGIAVLIVIIIAVIWGKTA